MSLTANDVQCAFGDQREDVGRFTRFLADDALQDLHQLQRLFVEDVEEAVEDLKVEGRRQQLPPRLPPLAGGQEHAVAQPRTEERVLEPFGDVLLAAKDRLHQLR